MAAKQPVLVTPQMKNNNIEDLIKPDSASQTKTQNKDHIEEDAVVESPKIIKANTDVQAKQKVQDSALVSKPKPQTKVVNDANKFSIKS